MLKRFQLRDSHPPLSNVAVLLLPEWLPGLWDSR
nr:MAG TPA: hypothetical protein [Caudoviricetes sp.]